MNVGQKAGQPLVMLLRRTPETYVGSLRPYSTTVAAPTSTTSNPQVLSHDADSISTNAERRTRIISSVVLSRPPLLTPEPSEFEQSYYFYQRRLNQRLALPFTRYFYFKKGTPADLEWKRKQAANKKYSGFGPKGWMDELLIGDNAHKSPDNGYQHLVDTTVTGEEASDSMVEGGEKVELDRPLSRRGKADETSDRKSLDRAMDRTLYLLVKRMEGKWARWAFPQSEIAGRENLKEAAERTLADSAGLNMNTWFVGNVPIGHYKFYPNKDVTADPMKVFFMKARIMAGQADIKNNQNRVEDFMWLTKEEIQEVAGNYFFNHVRHMLASR